MSIRAEKMDPASQHPNSHNLKCFCNKYSSEGRRRRLVVAFDGTTNQFGPESSHVVEFYSRIVKSGDQLSYYTSGIGSFVKPSSSARHARMWIKNKWAAALGLNFKSNLLAGYRFLSDKYERGDQIFLLGFSRGAYQARVLAAMITKVGLLRTGNNEQIPFAFEMYTDRETSKDIPIDSDHPERVETTTTAQEFKKAFCHDGVNIHFVGVWDTVSSVGVFRNKYYPGAELAENICFFRHALALDERRVKYIPEYIFAERKLFLVGEFGRPRCKEVWFRGFHSDVGGGNIKNITSDNGAIPSRWMAYEAMLAGLEMAPFRDVITAKNLEPKIGKESMTFLYALMEYVIPVKWENHTETRPPLLEFGGCVPPRASKKPRNAVDFSRALHCKRPRQIYDHQKLHSSVCYHKASKDESKSPFACLPDSWVRVWGPGWMRIIRLLQDEGDKRVQAVGAFDSTNENIDPREFPSLHELAPSLLPSERAQVFGNLMGVLERTELGIELDLLDCDAIPTLIAGILRGTNVNEFLQRLGVLACSGTRSDFICYLFTKCFRKWQGENSREQQTPILFNASNSLRRSKVLRSH
ncbi:Uncharacterized alpha/beta hydrolase domain (DUF2235) domain containing protein [Lactarius tabidus]